jgi:small-conductance mechanosensitive channel
MIKTIVPIIKSIIHWTLIIVTGLMIINVFVDITPLFFGIGVVGVALTIGSQTLIKDIVNGILLLFDGNVSVGDVVTIGNRTGTVESISLRALLLRHFTGELQTIPLSEVTAVINCSRDYSLAGIEFVVDPKAQIPSIQSAINATFKSIKHHPKYGSYIIGNLGDLGIKKMSEIGVTIKVNIPIKPDPKKDFIAEFNRQLYEQLQANEVPLAYARV